MGIKLVATDVDFTLLDSNFQLRQDVKETASALMAADVKLVLVTGRMYPAAVHVAEALELDVPIICYNGAIIRKGLSGEEIYAAHVPTHVAVGSIKIGKDLGMTPQIYVDDKIWTDEDNENSREYGKVSGVDISVDPDLSGMLAVKPTPKVLLMGSEEQIVAARDQIQQKYGDDVYITSSYIYFLDILAKQVNKGEALKKLAAIYNIEPQEILALGDNFNDLPLLKAAGIGVAMGNAVDSLKSAADYVTANHDAGGWSLAVNKFVFGK